MYSSILFCLTFTIVINYTFSARVLGIVPMASFSHQIVFRPLWKELSLRGHHVTVLTTDPMNNPELTNLTEVDWHSSYKFLEGADMSESLDQSLWTIWYGFSLMSHASIDEQLSHPEVQKLIKNEESHFDVVLVEAFHTAMFAFAERFKCPLIAIMSLDAPAFAYQEIGNPAHPVLHPDFMVPFEGKQTFTQRLASTYNLLTLRYIQNNYFIPNQQLLVKKHFGDDYPSIQDTFKNLSLFFVNTNPFFHPIRPLLPNVVQIGGGMHFTTKKPLPKDLQVVLDKATEGFIYFSLGTNVKSKHLSPETIQGILDAFRELPYTVLWKFENDNVSNKPVNVIISKWFPQQDILRHPNVKLFITQGGLQSIEEAIHNHIPLIGIPVVGDQKANVNKMVSGELGLQISYKNIIMDNLKSAVLEVITNKKYKDNVVELAKFLKDQPQTGLERAIWWTEYAIRHKGVPHLKNPSIDMPWYQYFLLDIIGFCSCISLIVIYLFVKLVKLLIKICYRFKSQPKAKEL